MTILFVRQNFLAVFDLGLKLCMFERATRPFVDTYFDTHFVHSVRNMVFLTEDSMPFLKLVGLGATADPGQVQIQDGGSANALDHSIVISSECTHVQHTIFLF